MALRRLSIMSVVGLAAVLAGCTQTKVPPPRFVATIPVPPPPPPVMPYGGYPDLQIADKRVDGTYVTPNFEMTDAAAVWHLRGALNVAALGCDNAGGGVLDGYNAWLRGHSAAHDASVKQYLHEWEEAGWGDWRDAYEANQTRLYNFYSQSTIRIAFCAAAKAEIATIGAVADADLPRHARGALVRLDQPFIDFYTAFDRWRDYYQPKVPPPKFAATVPMEPAPAPVASSQSDATVSAPVQTAP